MANGDKWIGLKVPLTILGVLAALVLAWFTIFKYIKPAGCFLFNDGTTQNWTLDQLYDTYSNPLKKITTIVPGNPPTYKSYTPFTLANYQNIALEADAGFYLVGDQNVKSADIFFVSPDLSTNASWQNLTGFTADARREFTGKCGDPTNSFFVQLQMKIVLTSDKSEHVIAQKDNAGKFVFQEMKLNTPYALSWNWGKQLVVDNKPLAASNYKIKEIKIRFSMPGYVSSGECNYYGKWKIGNVCPVK